MIEVVNEMIQRSDTLPQTTLDAFPLGAADDAGNQVERQGLFHSLAVAVYIESNARLDQCALGCFLP